jgi:Uma2 family endonuclease
MTVHVRPRATYEDLVKLPENMVGELIDGELYAWPRPAGPHARFSSAVGMDIGSPYDRGRGGPGGWWILDEPELHLGDDVLVPDLAGWRRERMPRIPKSHVFEVPPDWVCEVLSSSNARFDRIKKMPVYAQHEVAWAWLIDPLQKTLETFRLENGRWSSFATYDGEEPVNAEPFPLATIDLNEICEAFADEPESPLPPP